MSSFTIYEPAEDSFLIKKHIKKYAKGSTIEIGTGSGILAVEASKYAKQVIAVDIQKQVIEHCKKTHKEKKIKWKQSDLFTKIKSQQFDCIISNPPYLPDDPRVKDLALDGGKHGYELTQKLIEQVPQYLADGGTFLLLFSNLTKKNKVDEFIANNLLAAKKVDEQKLPFMETLYIYAITKSPLLKKLHKEKITHVQTFSKGKRGIVYKARYKKKEVIIKVKNPRSTALSTIQFEANWLKKCNKLSIGPKLYFGTKEFLAMEYIEGSLFKEYIEENSKTKITSMLKKLLTQIRTLDKKGINKQEMMRPFKHIIIRKDVPIMIDFERARHTDDPRNLTQFMQYLTSKTILPILTSKGFTLDPIEVRKAAKAYKETKAEKEYKVLQKLILGK